jgi:type II secretory pathway pseudopilin PulG
MRQRLSPPGFALLEFILALILLGTVLVTLLSALQSGLGAASDHESILVATRLAGEKIEEARNKSYSAVSSESRAAVSGYSPFEREVEVTTPQTDLKQVTVRVYWASGGDELQVSLVTYVSNI